MLRQRLSIPTCVGGTRLGTGQTGAVDHLERAAAGTAAAPIGRLPTNSAGAARGAEAAGLARRQPAVAAHVAVLAARDQINRRLVADVLDLPHGGGIHAREAAGAEQVLGLVVQADLDAAAVDEVELLLLLVEVAPGLEGRRQLDRVHAERGHAELAPHLPEPRPLGERIDIRHGVAVALHDLVSLVSHIRQLITRPARRCEGRRAPTGPRCSPGARLQRKQAAPWSDPPRGSL